MGGITEIGALYSSPVAFVYVFNLIIGVGALTMPEAFGMAGWLVATIMICILAVMSFITATFVVEAMAAANAVLRQKKIAADEAEQNDPSPDPTEPTTSFSNSSSINCETQPIVEENEMFELTERVEMGQMAYMFFNKVGIKIFYLCIAIYLYGDLAIYAVAVPKSLMRVSCGCVGENCTHNANFHKICFFGLNDCVVYRIYLAIFTLTLGPFSFFSVQKTKYLQIFTSVMRWVAFGLMIVLAAIKLAEGKGQGDAVVANFHHIPNLFGVCIYAFMCQHSIPSLITPLKDKSHISRIFMLDFFIVLIFYALLSYTAIFAFSTADLDDLYTLNFEDNPIKAIAYYLALFPVFTLSSNFPIISITLRDNLKSLCYQEGKTYPWVVDRILFPLVTIIPPIVVAFVTQEIEFLVGITGSYAGVGVQYVIPAMLVYCGRKQVSQALGHYENKHRSIFKHNFWVWFLTVWSFICISLVTVDHIISRGEE